MSVSKCWEERTNGELEVEDRREKVKSLDKLENDEKRKTNLWSWGREGERYTYRDKGEEAKKLRQLVLLRNEEGSERYWSKGWVSKMVTVEISRRSRHFLRSVLLHSDGLTQVGDHKYMVISFPVGLNILQQHT